VGWARTALVLTVWAAVAAGGEAVEKAAEKPAANNAAAGEWQKLETKLAPLPQPRAIVSPGLYDAELQKTVTFAKEGEAVELGLPQVGRDKAGNEYPPVTARLQRGVFWFDLNGDGKPGGDETRPVGPDGMTDPLGCELHYEDGMAGQYAFRLKMVAEKEKYVLLRACARVAEFQGKKIVLLDDNGNGKYDDVGKDAVIIGDGPLAFLGKYVEIGGQFYELLVHASGHTVEIRPAPKLDTGTVDLFEKYKPPQKSETLKIHTLIISGTAGSFAFDEKHRRGKVPEGAYDLVFGLFERAKETVYLKKGEKTSFTVTANQTATPRWGGVVKAKFEVSSEEKGVEVSPPGFFGEGSERYVPEHFRVTPVTAGIVQVFTDRMKLERRTPFGTKKFEVKPDGQLSPVVFKPYRPSPDEYEVTVDYNSGIMGSVTGRERLHYTPVKKKGAEKKAER
jgi:hypothetical protein